MSSCKFSRGVALVAVCLFLLSAMAGPASADLLVYEPFDYEEGWLTGQGGALGTTGTWNANETHNGDWRIHKEGNSADIVVAPGELNTFDGTVANLPTLGSYVGLPGPADTGADPTLDHEIGRNMNADIGLDPSVTASFQAGTTTWISYLSVRAWDRNEEQPNLVLGTDPAPSLSRGDNYGGIGTGGSGFGTGGGPTRNNRTDIYPMFYDTGQYNNVTGAVAGNSYGDAAHEVPDADGFAWQEYDDDGFGAANIVVVKLEWDADTNGEDIISLGRFLETDTVDEASFDALITGTPSLSSANWDPANKPSLDQSQFDTITFMGLKFFVDEIRIATTFDEVVGGSSFDPTDFDQDGASDLIDVDALTAVGDLPVGLPVALSDPKYDLTGDDMIDGADLDKWLTDAATINGFGSPYLKGDANLDGDVDVFSIDGSGDAQILSSNLGTTTGAVWSDGDFNGDGDVDVFSIDGSGDAQLLSSNLGSSSDAAPDTAEAIYDAATGELTFDVGTGIAVIGIQAEGLMHEAVATDSALGAPAQNGGGILAYFSASGLPAVMASVGNVLPRGLTAEDIGFSFTPIGGESTVVAVRVVPEPSTIALLLVLGAVALCWSRRNG